MFGFKRKECQARNQDGLKCSRNSNHKDFHEHFIEGRSDRGIKWFDTSSSTK